MRVIAGSKRFAEARVYGWYVLAVLRPGVEVPTFGRPEEFVGDLDQFSDDDLKVIVEEGRRQLDRQLADLEKNKSRAATMLTIGLAEIGVLAAGANRVFSHGFWATTIWGLSVVLAVLALGGAVSLLTSSAIFGRLETRHIAASPTPVLRQAALGYARSVGWGEETVRTRITVLRDGVLLAVASAMLYALIWPTISNSAAQKQPIPPGAPTTCPATCTTFSPNSPPSPSTSTGEAKPGMTTLRPTPFTQPR